MTSKLTMVLTLLSLMLISSCTNSVVMERDNISPETVSNIQIESRIDAALISWVLPNESDLRSIDVYHKLKNSDKDFVVLNIDSLNTTDTHVEIPLTDDNIHVFKISLSDKSGNKSVFTREIEAQRLNLITLFDVENIEIDSLPTVILYANRSEDLNEVSFSASLLF